jgi:hypothetical protein
VVFHTLLLPAGFVELNHDPNWHCALTNGLLTIRNADTLIRVDAASGRFLDGAPVDPASPNAVTAHIATGQLAAATDAFRNRSDPNALIPPRQMPASSATSPTRCFNPSSVPARPISAAAPPPPSTKSSITTSSPICFRRIHRPAAMRMMI